MKKRIIILLSIIFSVILFSIARDSAVMIRGNSTLGGEILIFFLPFLVEMVFENIKLARKEKTKKTSLTIISCGNNRKYKYF